MIKLNRDTYYIAQSIELDKNNTYIVKYNGYCAESWLKGSINVFILGYKSRDVYDYNKEYSMPPKMIKFGIRRLRQ